MMRKFLAFIMLTLLCVGSWAQEQNVATRITDEASALSSLLTVEQLKGFASTENHFAFVNTNSNARGWHTFGSGRSANLTTDQLYGLVPGSNDGLYAIKNYNGEILEQAESSVVFNSDPNEPFDWAITQDGDSKLINGEPTSLFRFRDAANSSTRNYRVEYKDFGNFSGDWAHYYAFGPFYVVTIKYQCDGVNIADPQENVIYSGGEISALNIDGYVPSEGTKTISSDGEIVFEYEEESLVSILQKKVDAIMDAIYADKPGYPDRHNSANTDLINDLHDYVTIPVPGLPAPINADNYDEVLVLYNQVINFSNVIIPTKGKLYKFSMVSKDGSKTWALKANGNTLTPVLDGEASTFLYCEITKENGEKRSVFVAEDGKILTYRGLTDNYNNLFEGNTCFVNDFKLESLAGKTSGNINSTPEQRFGYFTLTSDNRPSGQTGSLGCFILKVTTGEFDYSTAPFHNDTYTSAIKVEEVPGLCTEAATLSNLKVNVLAEAYPYRNSFGTEVSQYNAYNRFNKEFFAATWTEYKTKINEADDQDIVISAQRLTLNLPTEGFYRFKGHVNGRYITSSNAGSTLGLPGTRANDASEIFYVTSASYNKFKILNYKNGFYWGDNNKTVVIDGNVGLYSFEEAKNNSEEPMMSQYWIQTNNSYNDILQPWNNGEPQISHEHKNRDNQSGWDIEKVTSLPVTISAAGYSTLYTPVALTVPENVTAYIASKESSTCINLDPVDVIPANTGVIIKGAAGTYDFTIGGEADSERGILSGYVPTTAVEDYSICTLQKPTNKNIGMYLYHGTQIQGFKAFLNPNDPAFAGSNTFTFSFNDDDLTAIVEAIEEAESNGTYRNLMGQPVANPIKGQIYIKNGKAIKY